MTIPMTWFQSLNPLLVFLMTPLLLAHWRRRAASRTPQSSMRKMAFGALIVAGAYLLLAIGGLPGGTGPRELAVAGAVLRHVHLRRALHPADRPRAFRAAGAAGVRRDDDRRVVSRDLQRQPRRAGAVGTLWSRMSHARFFLIARPSSPRSPPPCCSLSIAATQRIERARASRPPRRLPFNRSSHERHHFLP